MHLHVNAVIDRLLQAREGGTAVPADFVSAHPLSVGEGLAVQAGIAAAMGAVAGWKVSSSSTIEKPSFAPIFERNAYGGAARFARKAFRAAAVECEVAFCIGRDLVRPPYGRDEIEDAIVGLVPVIEVCDSRLADFASAPGEWRLADGGRNGAMLVGTPVADWRSIDTGQLPVTLLFDGDVVGQAAGNRNPDLVASVQRLVEQAGAHCGGVRAGQFVATGSMTGTLPTGAATEVVGRFAGLGELQATFEQ